MESPLFYGIDSHYIFNRFYNFLVEYKVKKFEKLIDYEVNNDYIIIVKNGEYKVSIKMNLSEIDKLIVKLEPEYEKVINNKFIYGKINLIIDNDTFKKLRKVKHEYSVNFVIT